MNGGVQVKALAAFVAVVVLGCKPATPEVRMGREFDRAYDTDAHPTGVVREFELVAAEQELPLIDGAKLRVWAYNGQVPGPTLRVRLGDTVRARLTNRLSQPTTIHWHGVRVPNGMDGVPTMERPPIEPGGTFVYEFTPKDAGTFWFHPHIRSSEQVERGLYGVLVVEDKVPPPYAREVVWVLDDWLLDENRQIFGAFNTMHDLAHDGRWGNVITVNARTDTVLHASAGERIRLRLLNAANGRMFAPDFSGLDARVIAVDGLYVREPFRPDRFEIAPGNRVDLDIDVRGAVSGSAPLVDRFYPDRPNRLADFQVDGVVTRPAAFASPARARVPGWRDALTAPVTKEFRLNARRGGTFGIEWTINEQAFAGHTDVAAHVHNHPSLVLKRGAWARLRFVNESARLHPMHLHGMFFKLVARNGAPVDEPFFRDTVLIHGRETIDIGVIPLDAGNWMMHCHILEHAEAGMMTTIAVEP